MEVYSPKKFPPTSFTHNTFSEKEQKYEVAREVRNEPRSIKQEEPRQKEGLAERMRLIFYERLRAFFEYEEVS